MSLSGGELSVAPIRPWNFIDRVRSCCARYKGAPLDVAARGEVRVAVVLVIRAHLGHSCVSRGELAIAPFARATSSIERVFVVLVIRVRLWARLHERRRARHRAIRPCNLIDRARVVVLVIRAYPRM